MDDTVYQNNCFSLALRDLSIFWSELDVPCYSLANANPGEFRMTLGVGGEQDPEPSPTLPSELSQPLPIVI